ncbi:hypothetical protein SO802_031581 [Lithocarpus litseifolius]|uniref:RNase H type-1 domain-containing protein n=1 Tax=Lithocarpus litseifolius TaxID=425828 RepID=A0AAW2BKV8_9ROSI
MATRARKQTSPSPMSLRADYWQQPKNPRQAVKPRVVRWIPPISPSFKINFDGACFKEMGTAGMGVVVRDCSGSVLGALSQRIQLPSSAAIVELLACRRVMLFAKELRITNYTFKGDAKVVLQEIWNKDSTHPEYGHVINDVLSLATDCQFCSFSYVKRVGNIVAHFLAKFKVW